MSLPTMSSLLLFLIFSILCNTTLSSVRVWSQCSPDNYTSGGAYDTNVGGMLKNLLTLAGSYGGYGNDTAGDGRSQAYGLAICFADAPPDVCRSCLAMAAGNVTLLCGRSVAAAILYNNCLLRYANDSFFSKSDMNAEFSFYNNQTRADVDHFSDVLGRLMDKLAVEGAAAQRLFAYGAANLTGDQSLYGFSQCVRDLSPADCRGCLQSLAASLPIWTKGGRVYSLTCYLRFEVVPFYVAPNTPILTLAPPPQSTDSAALPVVQSRDAKSMKYHKKLALIVSIVATTILLSTCFIVIWKFRRSLIQGKSSGPKENIEELLEKYGTLAPKRYKYSQLKEIARSFSDKLGEGGYGMVYKGTLPDGRPVAVKFLHDFTFNGEEFVNEVISIGRTSHVNVVSLLGFCLEGSKRALVYEYMPNGSLEKHIYAENAKAILGWDKLYDIAIGIARGLEYLHRGCNTRIIHFDIKPHNILLDHEFLPKISDFGLAKLCNPKESYLSMAGMRGTVGFIAPEVFSRRFGVVSTKSDVYSYGMMLLEMVGGRKNLRASIERSSEVYFPDWIYGRLAQDGSLEALEVVGEIEQIARKMASIGLWCIQVSPVRRPTMSKVLEMFERSFDELEIPPKQYFYSTIQEDPSEDSEQTKVDEQNLGIDSNKFLSGRLNVKMKLMDSHILNRLPTF